MPLTVETSGSKQRTLYVPTGVFLSIFNSERAKEDLKQALVRIPLWNALAVSDIRSKYRLSTLGSFWITCTTGALALAIGLIYGQFFGQNIHDYLPYFTTTYIIWIFISSVIGEASTTLVGAGNLIKSSQMPIVFHVLRMLQRNLIIAGHNAVVIALVWPFIRWHIGPEVLLAVPGAVILYSFLAGAAVVIAIVCVRYRDIPPLIQVLIQFLFFISPVIWQPEQLRFGTFVLVLNPIAYMLAVVRDPILGRDVPLETWLIAAALAVASLVAGALMYLRFRGRIAYWV
jgi:ABC-type polysaccharide/polyol phosphate export permease